MCTAMLFKNGDTYFGRNLDLDKSYGEEVVITPRNFLFPFRHKETLNSHYAIIGMAKVVNNYPLYFDATNEKGLSIAGLKFQDNATYFDFRWERENIAPFEFIPWILCQAKDVVEAEKMIKNINIIDTDFSEELQNTPLHWIISDKEKSITVESVEKGIMVYENKAGVLTNNPSFDIQMFNLNNYAHLTNKIPQNTFSERLKLNNYTGGLGALGLPGDYSSMSRFVKTSFMKENSSCRQVELESVGQFFHIMDSVSQVRGINLMENGEFDITLYTSCCNTDKCIYYYTTYENHRISAVKMYNEDLNADTLIKFELAKTQQIKYIN